MTRKFHYEFDWEDFNFKHVEFDEYFISEFDAASYAIDWMRENKIDASKLRYCRIEEVYDAPEMRYNVILWIGE